MSDPAAAGPRGQRSNTLREAIEIEAGAAGLEIVQFQFSAFSVLRPCVKSED